MIFAARCMDEEQLCASLDAARDCAWSMSEEMGFPAEVYVGVTLWEIVDAN
jgi:hypothetical protein